jgi:uncharacterized protein
MKSEKHTNKLIHESSPYLLQHAHNPVNWYPWCQEALEKSKNEDKLILVSVGYAACHWCHVMERESFENQEIAEIMNQHFICIKVDREERPDIDQVYMDAVHIMHGNGGWPLNCFALPDGRPVYGGTYFRPQQWVQVLRGLSESYRSDKRKFIQFADELLEGMLNYDLIEIKPVVRNHLQTDLTETVNFWKKQFDHYEGGSKRAPKFPMPNSYVFLLEYYFQTRDETIIDHIHLTLNKMAFGGIYDQIGGGFARYSVDEKWHVPHFEKMLYDNAQLVSLYAKAYQLFKSPEYKNTVYQTIEFVSRELQSPENAFYSSLDADSQGEEGKYYVWEKKEISQLLVENTALYCDYYHITEVGNWEHKKNIPFRKENVKALAENYSLTEPEIHTKINECNQILLQARAKRVRPGLDNKILSAWNALMIKGLLDAYRAFGETGFLSKAIANAEFIKKHLIENDGKALRNYTYGKPCINGFLDDYAFIIDAFIALYQASFNDQWLADAKKLCDYAIEHFYDTTSGMFFYTSDLDEKLVLRKKEIHDNVIPASNSAMANNLFCMGLYFCNENYTNMSVQMVENVKNSIKKSGQYHSNWAILLNKLINPPYELIIMGNKALEYRKLVDQNYLPNVLMAGSVAPSGLPLLKNRTVNAETTIYVCRNHVCQLPVYSVEEALKMIVA